MMIIPSISQGLLAVFLLSASALALSQEVNVVLDGQSESPAVKTDAKGSGKITVGADHAVSGSVTTTSIEGKAAHIHQGAAGSNGPVIVPLEKSGENKWVVPAGAKLTDPQFAAFKAGGTYINVHTTANPNGEIRGQLTPK